MGGEAIGRRGDEGEQRDGGSSAMGGCEEAVMVVRKSKSERRGRELETGPIVTRKN
jgi:hypothetical protein